MEEHGFEPDFPGAVSDQLASLRKNPPRVAVSNEVRDLRNLLWSSIDNDTSRDLDQLEVAERGSNGDVKIMVGFAEVEPFAPKQRLMSQHAPNETTTSYTGVRTSPRQGEVPHACVHGC